VFYVAIPVGAAIGFGLGGAIGSFLGWRYAFLICGLPGVLFALLVLKVKDPGRGTFDQHNPVSLPWKEELKSLFRNKLYLVCVGGSILNTFAVGGIADWISSYLQRVDGVSQETAGLLAGISTVIGGLVGTPLGGILAETFKGKTRQPYFSVAALSLIPATLGAISLLLFRNFWVVAVLLILTQISLWCNSGPMNALIANSVEPTVRTRAFAIQILLIHLLGDAISPTIIGGISDATQSLVIAAIPIPIAMASACLVWSFGWRILDEPNSSTLIDLDLLSETSQENDELLDDMLSGRG